MLPVIVSGMRRFRPGLRWLLYGPPIADELAVTLMAPLYTHLGGLIMAHIAAIFVGVVALSRLGFGWHAGMLVGALIAVAARLLIVLPVRRAAGTDRQAILRSIPWYNGVSLCWASWSGVYCGLFVGIGHDQVSGVLAIMLALGTAAGIASRNAGTVNLALVQVFVWIAPVTAGILALGRDYWPAAVLTLLYVIALYTFVKNNNAAMLSQLHSKQALAESQSELAAIFENLATGLNETDLATGRFTRVNPVFCRMVGYCEAELLSGLSEHDLTHPDDRAALQVALATLRGQAKAIEEEKRIVRADGTVFWAHVSRAAMSCGPGLTQRRMITIVHDVTERKAVEAALRESETMLRLSMQAARIGFYQRDYVHRLIHGDRFLRAMAGLPQTAQPVPEAVWFDTVLPEDRARVGGEIAAVHARQAPEAAFAYRARIGNPAELRWFETRARLEYDAAGCPLRSIGLLMDVTDLQAAQAKIIHLAHHDTLTDLPNRALFRLRLDDALAQARDGRPFALCYIDLDRFKEVNDSFGHPIGDALLQAVSGRIGGELRPGDTFARIGGDEFALIQLGGRQPHDAVVLAQRLIARLAAPFQIEGNHIVIGSSIGIAVAPQHGLEADALLRAADTALYQAKGDGRGRLCCFVPDMAAQLDERRSIEAGLKRALAGGEFLLLYQPIVAGSTRQMVGCEALIRWQHPDRGLIEPEKFIAIAEASGFIVPIGEWVLREACAQAAAWPAPLRVAVNLSAVSFISEGLVERVAAALHHSGLEPQRLELEMTETVLMQDTETTLVVLSRLKSLGVRLAMDDFGTGFSSLSYLQRFPFDKVKIDRSFVAELGCRPQSTTIVRAVIDLCAALGLETTAEGVETEAQMQILEQEGCDQAQGFLFSPPVRAEALPLAGVHIAAA